MSSPDTFFAHAAEDRVHGASEIERELVKALLGVRQRWTVDGFLSGAERLLTGQPVMANLRNLAREFSCADLARVEASLKRRLTLLRELDERLAISAWPLIKDTGRVLTLSRSSAVAAVLEGAWRRGWRGEAVVFDGSPAGGGENQARRLEVVMGHVRSQPDATMLEWLDGGNTQVLVGADAVSSERLVNACGTAVLLKLAALSRVPALVVADSGKDLPDGEIDELLAAGPMAGEDVLHRRWPIFEAVPFKLVTTRIRE